MTMKRTELAKNKMIKVTHAVRIAGVPDRFGAGSELIDRKEQRRLDQAAGLIPFACKLPSDLVQGLHARVAADQSTMNELVASLLASGMGVTVKKAAAAAPPAAKAPAAKAPAAAPAVKTPTGKPVSKPTAAPKAAPKAAKAAPAAKVAKTAAPAAKVAKMVKATAVAAKVTKKAK